MVRYARYSHASGEARPAIFYQEQAYDLRELASTADELPSVLQNPEFDIHDLLPIGEQIEKFLGSVSWTDASPLPEGVQLLPPVVPEKIFCIGLNYADHAAETGAEPPSLPVVFSKFSTALIGPESAIQIPTISQQVDYEAELVVVIGNTCRNISKDEAMSAVFGYCCGHDVSARDWQKGRPGGQWLLGKTFDTFAPVGPFIAHHSVVGDPSQLTVEMRVNGETMQKSTTDQLIFDIPTLVSHLSQFCTLQPGDLIFTGTPPGVGAARTPPRFLQPGDVCEVLIDGLGVLRNPCVRASASNTELLT